MKIKKKYCQVEDMHFPMKPSFSSVSVLCSNLFELASTTSSEDSTGNDATSTPTSSGHIHGRFRSSNEKTHASKATNDNAADNLDFDDDSASVDYRRRCRSYLDDLTAPVEDETASLERRKRIAVMKLQHQDSFRLQHQDSFSSLRSVLSNHANATSGKEGNIKSVTGSWTCFLGDATSGKEGNNVSLTGSWLGGNNRSTSSMNNDDLNACSNHSSGSKKLCSLARVFTRQASKKGQDLVTSPEGSSKSPAGVVTKSGDKKDMDSDGEVANTHIFAHGQCHQQRETSTTLRNSPNPTKDCDQVPDYLTQGDGDGHRDRKGCNERIRRQKVRSSAPTVRRALSGDVAREAAVSATVTGDVAGRLSLPRVRRTVSANAPSRGPHRSSGQNETASSPEPPLRQVHRTRPGNAPSRSPNPPLGRVKTAGCPSSRLPNSPLQRAISGSGPRRSSTAPLRRTGSGGTTTRSSNDARVQRPTSSGEAAPRHSRNSRMPSSISGDGPPRKPRSRSEGDDDANARTKSRVEVYRD